MKRRTLSVIGDGRKVPGSGPPSPLPELRPGDRVLLVTLGCAKNQVDSEVILGALRRKGLQAAGDPELADVIVVNTCAFLQSAVEESLDRILELAQYKKNGRCRRLIVAGCLVERYRSDLVQSLPEADLLLSTDELLLAGELTATSADCLSKTRVPHFLYDESVLRGRVPGDPSAFVKVAEGCDRRCAFCIIPKLRGRYRSRSTQSVVEETHALLESGVREVNLVAQDLTAFGADSREGEASLPGLVRSIWQQCSAYDFWLRLLYAYPTGVTPALLEALRETPAACAYLDLPLQHISPAVLHRMHRPAEQRFTRGLIEYIRREAPLLALRTTFLTGFPGETEDDVRLLEEFISEGHFYHVGVFSYSPESEAESSAFEGQVAAEEREERRGRLMERQQKVAFGRLEAMRGDKMRVLLEGAHEESDMLLSGRAQWQAPETDGQVIISDAADELRDEDGSLLQKPERGLFAEVEITGRAGYDLVASLVRVYPRVQ